LSSLTPVLSQVRSRLEGQSETPGLDAQVLLAHILGRPRSWVLAHPEAALTTEQAGDLERALARLEQGEPLPYILGHWEFYSLDFRVTPATLIPRPETELLVERALDWLCLHPERRLAVDIGTGTGCIAVALAVHTPSLRLLACDLSLAALRVAQSNIDHHSVQERVFCLQADLLPMTSQKVDLICANLPYVPTGMLQNLPVRRWEPSLALDGGPDGLDLIRRLLINASGALAPGGLALLEIEETRGEAALQLAQTAFPHAGVELMPDLAGRHRLISIQT
jgi:release factor glutamine methyltransferase